MDVKLLCEKLHITQGELAQQIGISPQTLYNWSVGRSEPASSALKSISKKFDVSPTWLLTGEGAIFMCENEKFAAIDDKLLIVVLSGMELFFKGHKVLHPTAKQKGELAAALYNHLLAKRADNKIINFQDYINDNLSIVFKSLNIMR